jgi:type IV pilus assembly protein PilM
VDAYGVEPLPQHAMVDRNISDVGAVGEAIRRLVARARPSARRAAVAVAGSSVITRSLELESGLSDEQMEAQIASEADQYIPYPLEEVALDFQVRGPLERNSDWCEVLLAACRRESVETRQEALELADLKAAVVDIEPQVIERMIGYLRPSLGVLPEQPIIAVVDIGAAVTTLTVLAGERQVHTREQIFGGRLLTEEIERHYGMPADAAERGKLAPETLPPDYTSAVLDPYLDLAVQQVMRALQFFFSSSRHDRVDLVLLAGGSAALQGLAERVAEALGTRTLVVNPFTGMTLAPHLDATALARAAPGLLLACGLSMRSAHG